MAYLAIWLKSDPWSVPFFICCYTRFWRNPAWGHLLVNNDLRIFMNYLRQWEKVLWYFRVSNKNGVQLRSIGTCSRISGYQRARDEAKVDFRHPPRIHRHNFQNTKPRNGTDNLICENKVHQEVTFCQMLVKRH